MAQLTVQTATLAGVSPVYNVAAAGGDTFANDGSTYLHVKNGHTTAQTVTVDAVTNCDHGFDHDAVVSVTNAQERIIGPFQKARFNNASTGLVAVTYSGVTALTVAVVKLA